MIELENTVIQAEMIDIINTLKYELNSKGLDYLRDIKPNGDNIQCTCPFHKNGQERKPSFGININNGKAHCFSCNWSGDITTMISELFGHPTDFGQYGLKWLIRNFNSLEVENRKPIMSFNNSISKEQVSNKFILEEELDKYRYIHPYMYQRGLTDDIIEEFDIGYDKESKCLTFPVKDLKGNVVLVATRSVEGKFFHIPKTDSKPIYCAERFVDGKYKECYITESFLNCLTLWKLGKPAVALMGTGSSEQYKILRKLPVRKYIIALDPDIAGKHGTERLKRQLTNKLVREINYIDKDKDINDLQEDFLKLDEKY